MQREIFVVTMDRHVACAITLAVVWVIFAFVAYVPDVGRGFVKDDFRWVDAGHRALTQPAEAFLRQRSDFYRPIVELTFAADYAANGVRPRGYGFTNLALYAACVLGVFAVARAARLSTVSAAMAAMVWAVNPHGINMAVVWISGRTSLCVTLFALLAATAALQRRYVWTAICTAAALGSKEEAVLLPVVLVLWDRWIVRAAQASGEPAVNWRLIAALATPLAIYGGLRLFTGAMTPESAPPYYHLTFWPALVARNALEYADRAGTIGAVALLVAACVWRVRPAIDAEHRRLLAAAFVWTICGFALTLFVPVRSSLYAVFPSVGVALACGVVLDAMRARGGAPMPLPRLAAAVSAVLIAALPVYRARNGRYVEPARLSERALRTIAPQAAVIPAGTGIVLHDVDDPTSSFIGAFGTFASDAVTMRAGRDVTVWIDPPSGALIGVGQRPPLQQIGAEFGVERGRIFRVKP
jgi:hypothetical protein